MPSGTVNSVGFDQRTVPSVCDEPDKLNVDTLLAVRRIDHLLGQIVSDEFGLVILLVRPSGSSSPK